MVIEHPASNASIWTRFISLFEPLKKITSHKRFRFSEALHILRPFIYMISLMKYGKQSFKPLVFSLMIELLTVIAGLRQLKTIKKQSEKDELLKRRNLFLLKYFLKEPLFTKFTVPLLRRILGKFINESKLGFVLNILQYFSYYHYIV
jgi:hypothetical protein